MESGVQQTVGGWTGSDDPDRHITEPKAIAASSSLNGDHPSAFSNNGSSQQQHRNADQGALPDAAGDHPAVGDDSNSQQQHKYVYSPDSAIDLTVHAEYKAFTSSAIKNQSPVLSSDAEAPGKESTVESNANSCAEHSSSSSEGLASGSVGVKNTGADMGSSAHKEQQDSRDAAAEDVGSSSPGQPVSEAEDISTVPGVESEVEVAETVEPAVAGILDVDVEVSEDVEVEMEVPAADCAELGEVSASEVVVGSASDDGDHDGIAVHITENVVDVFENIESDVDVMKKEEIVNDHVANTVDVVDCVEITDDDVKNVEVNDDDVESTVDVGNNVEIVVDETVEITDSVENTVDIAENVEVMDDNVVDNVDIIDDSDKSIETTMTVVDTESVTVSVSAFASADDASVKEKEELGTKLSEAGHSNSCAEEQVEEIVLAEDRLNGTETEAEDADRTAEKRPGSTKSEQELGFGNGDSSAPVGTVCTQHGQATSACSNSETSSGDAEGDRVEQNNEEEAGEIVQGDDDALPEVEGSAAVEESGDASLNTTGTAEDSRSCQEVKLDDETAINHSPSPAATYTVKEVSENQCRAERDSEEVREEEADSKPCPEYPAECDADQQSGSVGVSEERSEGCSVGLKREGCGDVPHEHLSGDLDMENVADKRANDDKEGECDTVKQGVLDNKADEGLSDKDVEDSEDEADEGMICDETVDEHGDEKQSHLHSRNGSPDTVPVGAETSSAGTTFHRSGSREFGNIFEMFTSTEDASCYSPATLDGKESGKLGDKERNWKEKSPDKNLSSSSETLRQSRQSKRRGSEETSDKREPRPKKRRLSEEDDGKCTEMTDSESRESEAEEMIQHPGAKKGGEEPSLSSPSIDNKKSDDGDGEKDSKKTRQDEAEEAGKELSTLSKSDESAGEDDKNVSGTKCQSKLKKDNGDKDSDIDEEEDKGTSSENSDGGEDNDGEEKMKESKSSPSGTVARGNEERNIASKTDDFTGSQDKKGSLSGNVNTMDLDQSLGSCSDDSCDLSDGLNESSITIKSMNSGEDTASSDIVPAAEKSSILQNMNEGTQADFCDGDEVFSNEDDTKNKAVSDEPPQISASNNDLSDENETDNQPADNKNAASRVKSNRYNDDHKAGVIMDKTPQEKTQSNSPGDHSILNTKQKSKEVEGLKAHTLNEERGENSGETDKKGEATTGAADSASSNDAMEESPGTPEVHFSRVKTPKTYSRQGSPSHLARTTKLSRERARKVSDIIEKPSRRGKGNRENSETVNDSDQSLLRQAQESCMVQDPSKSKPSIVSRITKALNSSAHSQATDPTPCTTVSTPPATQAATKVRSVTRTRAAKATDKVVPVTQGSSVPTPSSQKTQGQTKAAGKVKLGSEAALTKVDIRQQTRRSLEQGSGKKQQSQLKKTGDGGVGGGVGRESSSGGGEHKCSLCGRTFAVLDRFRKHEKAHALGKNFCCETCGKLFGSEEKMATHKLVHQQSSTGTFTCTICGEVCQNWRPFLYHLSKHSANGGKKYTCDICGHTLSSNDRLRRHTETHKQGCNFCCYTCGKLFISQERLDKHTLTHSGKSSSGRGARRQLSTSSSKDQLVSRLAAGKGGSPAVSDAALPVPLLRATRKRLEEEEAEGKVSFSPGRMKENSHFSSLDGDCLSVDGSGKGLAAGELSPDACQLRKSSRKRKHSRQRCTCCRGSPVSTHQLSLSFPGPSHKRRVLEKEHEGTSPSGVAGSRVVKREWDQQSLKECSVKLERSPQLTCDHRASPEAHSLLKAVKSEIPSLASRSVKKEVMSALETPIKSEMSSQAGKSAEPEAFSAVPVPRPISQGNPAGSRRTPPLSTPSPIAPAPEDQSLPATTSTTSTPTPSTSLLSQETPKRPPKKAKRPASEPFEGRKVKIYRTASAKMLPKNLALSNASRERSRKGPREKAASKPEPAVITPPPPVLQDSSTPKRLFPCRICGESFPSDSAVKIHIGKHLTITPPKKVVVDIESVARSCHLSYSQGATSPEGGYLCHRCGYVARAYADLSKHMWMHSRKGYQCTECCASFSLAETLLHHMKAHSKGKTPPQHPGKGKKPSSQRSREGVDLCQCQETDDDDKQH